MRTRLLFLPVLSALALAGTACNGGSLALSYHDHRPVKTRHVHRHVAHVCTPECHHYHDGKRLVVIKGHRHGPGCGHVWNGKHWVLARGAPAHTHVKHVCTSDCHHHYHDGEKLVTLHKGHRHGPGCGHRWNGKHWVKAGPTKAKPHADTPKPPKKKIKPGRHEP